eukprot:172393_1
MESKDTWLNCFIRNKTYRTTDYTKPGTGRYNGRDIELFCKEFAKEIQSTLGTLQRNVDWNMLCVFGERFACIKNKGIRCDIFHKHWNKRTRELNYNDTSCLYSSSC